MSGLISARKRVALFVGHLLVSACAAALAALPLTSAFGQAPAVLYYIQVDHLNTPRAIYDQNQQLVWRWDQQEPFGNSPPNENPSGLGAFECNLRLPGQYFDKETNLAYNYFRDFDPSLGRYVESDVAGLAGGINTYSYVSGLPLSYVDPAGLIKWSGSITVADLGFGPKLPKLPIRIRFLRHTEITLTLESECVGGKKVIVAVRAGDPQSDDWRHLPYGIFGGQVDLEDGQSSPSGYNLQGVFAMDFFGVVHGSGSIGSGAATGSFTGTGAVIGGYTFRGRSRLLFPPKEESCVCQAK